MNSATLQEDLQVHPAAPYSAMIRSAEFRLKWIEKEVDILERKIEFFDSLSFKIKGWAIAAWSALTSFSLTQNDWAVCSLGGLVAFLFMIVDASYKRYQIAFIKRTRMIMSLLNEPEKHEREGIPIYDLLNIHGNARQEDPALGRWGSLFCYITRSSVAMVYWALITSSVVLTTLLAIR